MLLRRTGLPPVAPTVHQRSWRTWAYDETHGLPAIGKVAISFTPLARDRRSVYGPLIYLDTVAQIVDGLIAAGIFADKRDITDLILRPSKIVGVDGLEVVVLPAKITTKRQRGRNELHPERARI